MWRECSPPLTERCFGLLGLLGVLTFTSSIVVVHLTSTDIDWMRDYVSSLANEPLGRVFIASAFVHGWGNLALTLGLRQALHPGRLRTWAVLLFGLAASGFLVAALFPIDPPDQIPTTTGRVHRVAAIAIFMLELAALFVFSMAFKHQRRWQRQQAVSLVLSVSAAVALMAFVIAIQVDVAPGLAERAAMGILLVWEFWACFQLIRPSTPR
ncbi:MAG: DUF998 domain-containing protein [Acidiferrobacterales bacterium]